MADFFNTLQKSENALVAAAITSAAMWRKLRHTKEDLELLLAHNIAEIRFLPDGSTSYERAVVTGNNRFIEVYKAAKTRDKMVKSHTPFIGIKTRDPGSVMAFDLVAGKYKTIVLKSWQVMNLVTLAPNNILILD